MAAIIWCTHGHRLVDCPEGCPSIPILDPNEFTPSGNCIAPTTCARAGECRGLTPCRVDEPDPEKRLYPQWGTEDYRIFATLFNDITHAPRHIMFSDRKALAEYLWSQGWRREVRPEDVTE